MRRVCGFLPVLLLAAPLDGYQVSHSISCVASSPHPVARPT